MADDVMALDERIGRLEETVAKGFFDIKGRMDRLEDRIGALNNKFDVVSESLDGKIQTVIESLDAQRSEMRRTVETIRQEHQADRRLMYAMLRDHGVRIRGLESDR